MSVSGDCWVCVCVIYFYFRSVLFKIYIYIHAVQECDSHIQSC